MLIQGDSKTTSQDALQSAIVGQVMCFDPPKNRAKEVFRHTPSLFSKIQADD